MNLLASFMIYAPELKDPSGFFPDWNIETRFASLKCGLEEVRGKAGEARYQALVELSARMRKHF